MYCVTYESQIVIEHLSFEDACIIAAALNADDFLETGEKIPRYAVAVEG